MFLKYFQGYGSIEMNETSPLFLFQLLILWEGTVISIHSKWIFCVAWYFDITKYLGTEKLIPLINRTAIFHFPGLLFSFEKEKR